MSSVGSVEVTKYSIVARPDRLTVALASDVVPLASLFFRFDGVTSEPRLSPKNGVWPEADTIVTWEMPLAIHRSVVDMLRNEKPVWISVNQATTPIRVSIGTGPEATGELEP